MSKQPPSSTTRPKRAKRPGRWLRRFIILLGVVFVLVGVVSYFTRPARLNRVLVELLEESIGCQAQVGQAHLTWDGLLTVDGIDLTVPDADGEMAQLLHTDRVAVKLRLLPLATGRVRAASVALSQPTLYLTEDLDLGRFNYEMLLSQPSDPSQEAGLPDALPELHINGGQVRFGEVSDGAYQQVESILVDGNLIADSKQDGVYDFILAQRHRRDQSSAALVEGEIDLNTPSVELEVRRFTFDGPYRYLLPREVRSWWDRLQPRGTLPSVVLQVYSDDQGHVDFLAEMKLDGFGLSVPLVESNPLDMADVTGTLKLTSSGVSFENVTGMIEDIAFTAGGRFDGYHRKPGYELSVKTKPFDLPAEGGVWDGMPHAVSKYRERFSPQGMYEADVVLKRASADEDLQLFGHVDLIDTKFMYYRFKYPAEKLTGRISLHGNRIVLNDLVGIAPSGARAVVSGEIGPPIKDGTVRIVIHGEDMPLDEHLTNAMSEKRRKVLDMFFSQTGYESLLSQGVIRRPGETVASSETSGSDVSVVAANDAVSIAKDVPEFEPGGSATMTVTIQRPAGTGQKYQVTTNLQTDGLNSVFDFWHYPLVAEGGRVVITPDDVEVHDVRLRALNGGGGVIQGRLDLPREGSRLKPNLQLTSVRLPVDDLLVASIPKPKDQWVRSLNITGELVGTGEVFADPTGDVLFTVDSVFRNGRATPNAGRYTLEDVQGSITVERKRVQIEDFTGKHNAGTITLNGQADFGDQGVGVDLTFIGDNLPIKRGLIDLVPADHEARPMLTELFETYKPDGLTDAKLVYLGGREEPDTFSLNVQPHSLAFDFRNQRIELNELDGTVSLTPSKATLHHVSGRYPAGTFSIDGEVRLDDGLGLGLNFNAKADRLDATARALMPKQVRSLVDRLELRGPFELEDATLLTWPGAEQGPSAIFEADVLLRDASAQMGVALTEIHADLGVRVVTFSNQPWPHTDIQFSADHLRASDRLVRKASMHVQTGDRPSVIDFNQLKGSVYSGALVGRGQAVLDPPGSLGFELTLQEVELEPFLNPLGENATSSETATPDPTAEMDTAVTTRDLSSGLLSAGLSIRVPLDGSQSTQGRGIVTVRDATLYDKPLTLAVLQAANLSLPNESSFDRASARYLILGDTVLFDDIRFEAPAFVIAGNGSMAYPSTELNLRMVTHNPEAPDLGPVSELVKTFKDELLAIEVKGTLAKPVAGVVPLEGVFRSWGRIFGDTRAGATEVEVEQPFE